MPTAIETRLLSLLTTLKSSGESTRLYDKATRELYTQMQLLATGSTTAAGKIEGLKRALSQYSEEQRKLQKIYDDCEKMRKKYTNGLKENLALINDGIGKMKLFSAGTATMVGTFAAMTFSLKGANETLLKYNQSMFNLSRTQQIYGRSISDVQKAIQSLGKDSIFSKQSFLDLSEAINNSYLGIKPLPEEIAKIARGLQNAFGPNLEVIKAKAMELYSIQNKYPRMYDDISRAMEAVNSNNQRGAAIIQQGIVQKALAMNMSQKEIELIVQATTKRTAGQKQQVDYNTQVAQAQKASADAMLKFAQTAEPMLKEVAKLTETLARAAEYASGAFVGLSLAMGGAQAFKAVQSGMQGVSLAAQGVGGSLRALNATTIETGAGLGIIGTAAMAAASAMLYFKSQAEQAESINMDSMGNLAKQTKEAQEKLKSYYTEAQKSLTPEQLKGFWVDVQKIQSSDPLKNTVETTKLLVKLGKEHGMVIDKSGNLVTKNQVTVLGLGMELKKINQDYEAQYGIVNNIISSINNQISAQQELRLIDPKTLDADVAKTKEAFELSKNFLKDISTNYQNTFNVMIKGIDVPTVDLNIGTDDLEKAQNAISQIANVEEILKQKRVGASKEQQALIDDTIQNYSNARLAFQKQVAEYTSGQAKMQSSMVRRATAEYKLTKEANSAWEQRLAVERELQESAQFGMGASVTMMQKQVDMNLNLIKSSESARKALDVEFSSLTKEQKEALKLTTDRTTAEKLAAKLSQGDPNKQKDMLRYAETYNNLTKDQMEYQKKIYDLTKEIREGYLDAMREMRFGAGEFSEIIASQSEGTEELIGLVNQISGKKVLNTMGLGGTASLGSAGFNARTELTGQMTTGGLKMAGGSNQNARNADIYNYNESMVEYQKRMKGEGSPTVGSGLVAQTPSGDAAREAGDKTVQAVVTTGDRTINALDRMTRAILVTVTGGNSPGQEPRINTGAVTGLSASLAASASGGTGSASKFANGGQIRDGRIKNKPILVGEKGPEILFPQSSGYVVSNDKIKQTLKEMRNDDESVTGFAIGGTFGGISDVAKGALKYRMKKAVLARFAEQALKSAGNVAQSPAASNMSKASFKIGKGLGGMSAIAYEIMRQSAKSMFYDDEKGLNLDIGSNTNKNAKKVSGKTNSFWGAVGQTLSNAPGAGLSMVSDISEIMGGHNEKEMFDYNKDDSGPMAGYQRRRLAASENARRQQAKNKHEDDIASSFVNLQMAWSDYMKTSPTKNGQTHSRASTKRSSKPSTFISTPYGYIASGPRGFSQSKEFQEKKNNYNKQKQQMEKWDKYYAGGTYEGQVEASEKRERERINPGSSIKNTPRIMSPGEQWAKDHPITNGRTGEQWAKENPITNNQTRNKDIAKPQVVVLDAAKHLVTVHDNAREFGNVGKSIANSSYANMG